MAVGLRVPTPSPLCMLQPHCGVLPLLQVDLPALACSTWLVPRHPRVGMTTARDFPCVHRHKWWCVRDTLPLKSMSRQRKIPPSDNTLLAKGSFPTRKSSWCFVILSFPLNRSVICSSEILAVIHSVLITIQRSVSQVDGSSKSLIGVLISLHKERIACWLSEHSGKPAVKKSSR